MARAVEFCVTAAQDRLLKENPLDLRLVAQGVVGQLGRGFHLREDYAFSAPENGRVSERLVDAAIFSSPVPSVHTATMGFAVVAGVAEFAQEQLRSYAYLGAPLLVTSADDQLAIYEFNGRPVAEKIAETPILNVEPVAWIRERADRVAPPTQLSLALEPARSLLLEETKSVLSASVADLMTRIRNERNVNEVAAFRMAMLVIRQVSLAQAGEVYLPDDTRDYVNSLAPELTGTISFANIPPEAIAEFYETFAVASETRRRRGVVYTPAWLARYVIDSLPNDAFRRGRAIDPTCGSGTFMVCYLERLVEECFKQGLEAGPRRLKAAVFGMDIDPVAIEATRLSLDFFCRAIDYAPLDWNLAVADATEAPLTGEWVVGNLPFGYRTYGGNQDVSAAILQNIVLSNEVAEVLALILPESLAYTASARQSRRLVRERFRIQEITRLPGKAFEAASERTMVVFCRKGPPSAEAVIREVGAHDLSAFRSGSYVSRSYVSRLPGEVQDPWLFSPLSNEFEAAERRGLRLGSLAKIHVGLQIYGTDSPLSAEPEDEPRPLLTDPDIFARWTRRSVDALPHLVAESDEVRRKGPWDLFSEPKVIVRITTTPGTPDRLAAIPDCQGVWFTDKFVGIWVSDPIIGPEALAAYLQTNIARAWFDGNNPSRKLRVRTFRNLPVPKLPRDWWLRASSLAKRNELLRPPERISETDLALGRPAPRKEWQWFNSAVESALGLGPTQTQAIEDWLLRDSRD